MSWELSVTGALLGSAFLFAYLYVNTDQLNKFLKVLFLAGAMLFGMGALAVQDNILQENSVATNTTIVNTLHSTYGMSVWVFRISLILVFFWLVYAALLALFGKSERFHDE